MLWDHEKSFANTMDILDMFFFCKQKKLSINRSTSPPRFHFHKETSLKIIAVFLFCINECSGNGNIFRNTSWTVPVLMSKWLLQVYDFNPWIKIINLSFGTTTNLGLCLSDNAYHVDIGFNTKHCDFQENYYW